MIFHGDSEMLGAFDFDVSLNGLASLDLRAS